MPEDQLKIVSDDVVLEMVEKYKEEIVKPIEKSKNKIMICPVGLVGSGKTTVMKPLAERLSLVRVSNDDIRKMLFDHGYKMERNTEIIIKVTEELAALGYSIAVDADCAPILAQETINDISVKHSITVFWIHINPPEEFIIQKLTNFKHTWLFKNADDAVAEYHRRKSLHQNLALQFIFTFDTSRNDLEDQIEKCVLEIKKVAL